MNFLSRIKFAFKAAVAGWSGQGYDFTNWAGKTLWGIDNGKLVTNETIFSVISRLANTLSSLPIKLYKNYDLEMNQAADVVINNPNPNMTSFEIFNKVEVSRNETGNGYAIIRRDIRMQPEQLLPINSSNVTPFINNDDGELWYKVIGNGKDYYFHNMNMFHVKHISGAGRWKGINPLEVLRNTLDFDKSIQEFSLSEMQKKDSFILTYATNVDKEKRQQIVDDFKRFYTENGGILFREPGVTIDEIDRKYFASDIISSERITRSRVANVFNVPTSFLNEVEGGFSSNEQLMIQFVQMSLTPTVRQYEQELNRKLLTPADRKAGFYFKFNMGGLLRGDTAARTNFYQAMLRSGAMDRDEVRRFEDLPPRGGQAAELWISGDMYPLEMDPTLRKGGDKSNGEGKQEQLT
ncbi:phage portal protein [Fictibacillus sp. JL2B1089]|uniref:phage portal protein n=1 Tax=Fictibacillus sp. JL2B1089 TaxID=3399565 RepID=UPI003A8811BA